MKIVLASLLTVVAVLVIWRGPDLSDIFYYDCDDAPRHSTCLAVVAPDMGR